MDVDVDVDVDVDEDELTDQDRAHRRRRPHALAYRGEVVEHSALKPLDRWSGDGS